MFNIFTVNYTNRNGPPTATQRKHHEYGNLMGCGLCGSLFQLEYFQVFAIAIVAFIGRIGHIVNEGDRLRSVDFQTNIAAAEGWVAGVYSPQ